MNRPNSRIVINYLVIRLDCESSRIPDNRRISGTSLVKGPREDPIWMAKGVMAVE